MPGRHALTILAVRDPQRAARFYERALGLSRVVQVPVYVELVWPDGMRLGLYEREGFGRNVGATPREIESVGPAELYVIDDALEEACARVEAAGARVLSARAPRGWGDEVAYYADPDGHVLALARPLAAADAGGRREPAAS